MQNQRLNYLGITPASNYFERIEIAGLDFGHKTESVKRCSAEADIENWSPQVAGEYERDAERARHHPESEIRQVQNSDRTDLTSRGEAHIRLVVLAHAHLRES